MQMKSRGILQAEIVMVLQNPDVTEGLPVDTGKFRYRKYRSGRRAVDVVFDIYEKVLIVVTAMIVTLKPHERPDSHE